jgi:acyl carrier protein
MALRVRLKRPATQENASAAPRAMALHRGRKELMLETPQMQGDEMLAREMIIERTREYIAGQFLYMRSDVVIEPSDSLLERGIIDSMGVVELLAFVEETFAVPVADDEITEEHFGSLDGIARFVTRKRTAAVSRGYGSSRPRMEKGG